MERPGMRIVYALNSLARGGAEQLVTALAGRMAGRGHTVLVMVLKPAARGDLVCPVETVYLGFEVGMTRGVRGVRDAVRLLRGFKPNVIHSHSFHANILMRLVGAVTPGAAVISTIHNVYEGGRLRMLGYRMTDRLAVRTAAVCAAAARRFEEAGAVKHCGVVRNAIEVERYTPDISRRAGVRAAMGIQDEFVWLAVGRDAPAKDYPTMLAAFERARERRPDVRLWIAGAERPEECTEGVRWLGMREDVAGLLDGADGFVLSSAWEGMPLAVAEAMAMEKPVVATDVGGVRELVGDCGVLVGAADAAGLGVAITEMMGRSAKERGELGSAARLRIVAGFDLKARVEEWERVYLAC